MNELSFGVSIFNEKLGSGSGDNKKIQKSFYEKVVLKMKPLKEIDQLFNVC